MTANDLIREIMTECGWRPETIEASIKKLDLPDAAEIAPEDVEQFKRELRKTAQHFLLQIIKRVEDEDRKVSNN